MSRKHHCCCSNNCCCNNYGGYGVMPYGIGSGYPYGGFGGCGGLGLNNPLLILLLFAAFNNNGRC